MNVQQKLADLLGIEFRGRNVTGFDVRVRAFKPVEVSVHQLVTSANQFPPTQEKTTKFTIEAVDEPEPLDLDKMAAEAVSRVNARIWWLAEVAQHKNRHWHPLRRNNSLLDL